MKNILSYGIGTIFTGKEIKTWIKANLSPESSHFKTAKTLIPFLNLKDNMNYALAKENYNSCASYHRYIFLRV